MNIRELVRKAAQEKYPNNKYVKDRVESELGYFDKNDWFKQIEILLKIKEIYKGQNVYIFPIGLLSLYLLELEYINPMPAHYYEPNKKTIIFDNSASYGVDLPKKDGFHRDGFDITGEYILNLKSNNAFRLYLYEKHSDLVKDLIGNIYPFKSRIISWNAEEISYGSTIITFKDSFADNFLGRDLIKQIDVDDFLLSLNPKKQDLKDIMRFFLDDNIEVLDEIKSFGKMVELSAILRLTRKANVEVKKTLNPKFPRTSEDIFLYLKNNGYSAEESAKLANDISFGKNTDLNIKDNMIKKYLQSFSYITPKAFVLHLYLRDYFIALNLKKEESKLFDEWKTKHKEFVPDGLVNVNSYVFARPKITVILKEVNAKNSLDLMNFLRKGAEGGKTWNNTSRWVANILYGKNYDKVDYIGEKERKKYLAPISVINLKKTHGGGTAHNSEIDKFAKTDKEFIKKQLEIYHPDIIICGGTGDIFIQDILDLNTSDWTYVSDYFSYLIYKNKIIVRTYHPGSSKSKTDFFEKVALPIKELWLNQ